MSQPLRTGAAVKQGEELGRKAVYPCQFTSLLQKMMGYILPTGILSDKQTGQILQTSRKCFLPPPLQKYF